MRRRAFLAGGAALGAGAALGRVAAPGAEPARAAADGDLGAVPFEGRHQAGVTTPRPSQAIFAAFDAITESRAELADALRALSDRARAQTRGYAVLIGSPGEGPTPDSGILGPKVPPNGLTVTIGFGASLFDERFGLAARKPRGLKPMRTFPDDQLAPHETHGDVLLQLNANDEQKLLHALRDFMRTTRGVLAARWKIEGFTPAAADGPPRNLLGFRDGVVNPATDDEALMNKLVWHDDGGTFQVVRIIRNRVEFWDRVSRSEQELMIGRDKASGVPLGKPKEHSDPDYASDPKGERIPLDAHIRLARPRTTQAEESRILRRGFNYSRGIDASGQLDMGLIFVAFNRDLEKQFEATQRRLAGEPLVDYVVPTGGGYFYVPPGARDGQDWVGSDLLAD